MPKVKRLWEARDVFTSFGRRDVTLRYRQTALGVVWVFLQPLLTALVFTLVFGRVAKLSSDGIPYVVFTFTGLLAWNMFSNVINKSASSLVRNAALVSKVFFPRVLVPLSSTISALVDFVVALVLLVVLQVSYQVPVGPALILLPLWIVLVLLLANGLGVVLAALQVRYRDVQYVVPFVLQVLLYASPIGYAVSNVPEKWRWVYDSNPITWLLEEFRWSLLDQPAPSGLHIALSVLVCGAVFVVGNFMFEHMERGLADVI